MARLRNILTNLTTSGLPGTFDSEPVRKATVINLFTYIGLAFMLFFGIESITRGDNMLALVMLALGGLTISVFVYLRQTKNYAIAGNAIVLLMFILVVFLLVTGGANKTGPLWYFVFPATALFTIGRKEGSIYIGLLLALTISIFYFEPDFAIKYETYFKFRFLASFIAVYVMSYVYEYVRERTYVTLVNSNKQKTDYLARVLQQKEEIQMQAENLEAVNKELENLSIVASKTDNAVFIMNANGDIEWVNQGFSKMHGYTLEEFRSQVGVNLLDVTDNSELSKNIHECITSKKTLVYSARNRSKGGEYKWLQTTLTPVTDKNGELIKIVAIDSDFTEIKMAEQKLRTALEAEENSRIKSEFIANMSHEVRTPLNAIIGFSRIVETDEALSEKGKENIRTVISNGKTLLKLINDILNLSKAENNTLESKNRSVNIADLVSEIYELFHDRAHAKGIEMFLNIPNPIPTLFVDDQRLRQILLNIIGNAVKFTEEGHVKVSIGLLDVKDKLASLNIAVEDTGIGIEYEKQKMVFEAFSQAKGDTQRKYGGTGLGLTITKRLINGIGGEIRISSEKDKGTKVDIVIPDVLVASNEYKELTQLNYNMLQGSASVQEKKSQYDFNIVVNQILAFGEERIHEFDQIITEKVFVDYEHIKRTLRIKQMQEFAKVLNEIGREFNLDEFVKYSEDLRTETDKFSISTIKYLIPLFQEFVNAYRTEILFKK